MTALNQFDISEIIDAINDHAKSTFVDWPSNRGVNFPIIKDVQGRALSFAEVDQSLCLFIIACMYTKEAKIDKVQNKADHQF